MVTFIDGNWVADEHATVSVRSRGLNYGLGCFGGIRGYLADDGEQVNVFRLEAHVRRLDESAKILCLPMPIGRAELSGVIIELLHRNDVHNDIYIRPMIISKAPELAPLLRDQDASIVVWCMPLKRYIDKDMIDVCVSSWRRISDNALPARTKPLGGYVNSALARREAHDNGFDEAILLTERGSVSEGSAEHVFLIREGVLYSPPSTEDNLDGITRRSIIALAGDLGIPFVERTIGRTELYVADEMFLCGTGAQVTPVRSVDRRTVGDAQIGPITRKISGYFDDVVHGRVAERREWLTPVWT